LHTVAVFIPDTAAVKEEYSHRKNIDADAEFPYWSQIWPAAIGLCDFLSQNLHYIERKKVTELAAGLALPSLFAATYAREVHCSDYINAAVQLMKRSIDENKLLNTHCSLLDWNHLSEDFATEILLLSDINYDETVFPYLYKLLISLLHAGTIIILSTPQRLLAKPFIDKILSYCIEQREIAVNYEQKNTTISVLVLKKG
jgi:predicted nicotinamide N-methyase